MKTGKYILEMVSSDDENQVRKTSETRIFPINSLHKRNLFFRRAVNRIECFGFFLRLATKMDELKIKTISICRLYLNGIFEGFYIFVIIVSYNSVRKELNPNL